MRNIVLIDQDQKEAELLTTQLRQFGYSVTRFDGTPDHHEVPEMSESVALLVSLRSGADAALHTDGA